MRRKDREIKDTARIHELLDRFDYGHLSLCDGGKPYGVTMNFGYEIKEDGTLCLYFHGAEEGRKTDCIRKNKSAYFFAETGTKLFEGEKDGVKYWTMHYSSVAAEGEIELVNGLEEKYHALGLLMKHFIGDRPFDAPESLVRHTAVMKMTVTSITCKQNPRQGAAE